MNSGDHEQGELLAPADARKIRSKKSAAKLLGLLTEKEWSQIRDELGLTGSRREVLGDPERLGRISSRTLVEAILDIRGAAFEMLGDVFRFLGRHKISSRTTAAVGVLPGLTQLTPQQERLVVDWSATAGRRATSDSDLTGAWVAAEAALSSLCKASSPVRAGARDPYQSFLGGGRGARACAFDHKALEHGLELSRAIVDLLGANRSNVGLDAWRERAGELLEAFELNAAEAERQSAEDHERGETDDNIEAASSFLERLRLKGDLRKSATQCDMIHLSVFRYLPQLFEVWVLCFILEAFEDSGYRVLLLQVFPENGSGRWNLRFAKARDPVAEVVGVGFVYFQFEHRKKKSMPDIAIWRTTARTDPAIAVFDPKYSEAESYSLAAYRDTYQQYTDAFGGPVSIVEHEDRADMAEDWLVLGARPGSESLEILKERLIEAATASSRPIAVVDVSSSYSGTLTAARAKLARLAEKQLVRNIYITFAATARIGSDLRHDLEAKWFSRFQVGEHGTSALELLAELEKLPLSGRGAPLLFFSDMSFDDGSIQTIKDAGYKVWTLG